jgi:hypothetical protein
MNDTIKFIQEAWTARYGTVPRIIPFTSSYTGTPSNVKGLFNTDFGNTQKVAFFGDVTLNMQLESLTANYKFYASLDFKEFSGDTCRVMGGMHSYIATNLWFDQTIFAQNRFVNVLNAEDITGTGDVTISVQLVGYKIIF